MPRVVFPGNAQNSACRVSLPPSLRAVCTTEKKVIFASFSRAIINIIYLLRIAVEPKGLD